jgi:hypothetical protein
VQLTCRGQRFEYVETLKHDFFAATGLYRGPDGLAVLKMGRQNDFLTVPMDWIGAFLTRREVRIYELLQSRPGVPRLIGPVGRTGFLHEYVPGHSLGRREPVSDTFFDELQTLITGLHARDMAYVDLNKRQNILLGDDGRPYLIDFQISLHLPPIGWRRLWPVRWVLRRFQHGDRYHCLKHKRRLSFWIRLHRWWSRPLTKLRRRALNRLARSESGEVAGSSAK